MIQGTLSLRHDIIVMEGAGSPAEINLKENDIVNMGLAEMTEVSGKPVDRVLTYLTEDIEEDSLVQGGGISANKYFKILELVVK